MMPRLIVFLFFLILIHDADAQFDLSRVADAESRGLSSDSLRVMNDYFHGLVDDGRLAGIQIGVIKDGELVHYDSYGYDDIATGKELTDESIFRIFSMTKPIVSVALMQLYEQGRFDLQDPVYEHLPELRELAILSDSLEIPAQRPIRIIDLLRHTSGYTYGRSQNALLNSLHTSAELHSSLDNAEYVERLSRIPLAFEPGTGWQYGVSTNVCGRLIEVLSGKSLQRYLADHVLDPLGMKDTHFQIPESKVDRFVTGYSWTGEELAVAQMSHDNDYVRDVTLYNGGGGLVSTMRDYLQFCQMLLYGGVLNEKRVLQDSTVALMFRDHLKEVRPFLSEPARLPMGEASFGLGFAIRGEDADHLERVYGWGGAVGTYFKVDLDRNMAYVMMIQLSPYRHLGLRERLQSFVESAVR